MTVSFACQPEVSLKEAEQLLDRVGLLDKKDNYPRQLSGGQKQRVAIVRAMLMHPEIMRRIELGIDRCDCASFVMIDAPLLFESGWDKSVELVIAVWSSPEIQMERLLARGWTVDHAQARIASQMPAHKKLELADYGIINNASLAVLEEQCVELRNKLN